MTVTDISHDRKFAISNGLVTYLGKVCVHGHAGVKYTKSGKCIVCAALQSKSDSKKQYDKNRYIDNIDVIKENRIHSYYLNKEKENAYAKLYADNNKDKIRLIKSNYKFKRRAVEKTGDSTKDVELWLSKQQKICYWCMVDCNDSYHIDHYEPLSKGGTHTIDNLVIACPTCNLTKNAKDPYKFALTKGKLF